MAHTAYLGLASNLGDRLETLQRSVDLLADRGARTVASSRVWETEPIGGPDDQPPFLNAVVRVETDLDAGDLLGAVNAVEAALGDGSELVHQDLGTNKCFTYDEQFGDYESAKARADIVFNRRYVNQRLIPSAMEPR